MMMRRIYTYLIAALCIISWFITAAQPFSSWDQSVPSQQDQLSRSGMRKSLLQSLQKVAYHSKQFQGNERRGVVKMEKEEQTNKLGMSRLGSRPPNCDHRCGECKPCIAIQVPTNNMQLQSANYGPEGWTCKCGSSFFTP